MRAIVQRVSKAAVRIDTRTCGEIGKGIVVFLGVRNTDNEDTIKWMANKLVNLRIFPDEDEKMNLSVDDVKGGILIVSNFTLYGDARKGFRPSYAEAADPEIAEPVYERFVAYLKHNTDLEIKTGIFGAMMSVDLTNDGPVTLLIEKESEV